MVPVDAKKLEAKKVDAKAEAAKKAALAKAAAMKKKKEAKVDVVNTAREQTMNPATTTFQPTEVVAAAALPKVDAPAAAGDTTKSAAQDDETVLTPAQWRALLQNSPTSANIASFIKAKQSGKLDATSYYQITHELLVDSAVDRETAGVSIVKADPSASTFSFMVTELSKVSASVQTKLQAEIASYSSGTKLSLLIAVLSTSTSPTVLTAATTDLATALASYQAHPSGQPSTQGASVSLSQLAAFKTVLDKLAKGSTSVAAQATQLLTGIQNISPATPS